MTLFVQVGLCPSPPTFNGVPGLAYSENRRTSHVTSTTSIIQKQRALANALTRHTSAVMGSFSQTTLRDHAKLAGSHFLSIAHRPHDPYDSTLARWGLHTIFRELSSSRVVERRAALQTRSTRVALVSAQRRRTKERRGTGIDHGIVGREKKYEAHRYTPTCV